MRQTTVAAIAALLLAHANAPAQNNTAAVSEQDGKHFTADDVPTYSVAADGTVDWYTFSGFRRYHSECHVCHGPDGQGSSYAPALADSALQMDYYDFVDVVVNGRVHGNSVMPSFGTNLNVMCYLDDIYIYLKAVGSEAIPRGRPAKKAEKPDAFTAAEDACMG
jgi:methanol metabolism-related c-type cytochrome